MNNKPIKQALLSAIHLIELVQWRCKENNTNNESFTQLDRALEYLTLVKHYLDK